MVTEEMDLECRKSVTQLGRVYLPRFAKDWCTQLLLEQQRRVLCKNIDPCEPNTYVAHDTTLGSDTYSPLGTWTTPLV